MVHKYNSIKTFNYYIDGSEIPKFLREKKNNNNYCCDLTVHIFHYCHNCKKLNANNNIVCLFLTLLEPQTNIALPNFFNSYRKHLIKLFPSSIQIFQRSQGNSSRNENFNLLVRNKFLNLFLYKYIVLI